MSFTGGRAAAPIAALRSCRLLDFFACIPVVIPEAAAAQRTHFTHLSALERPPKPLYDRLSTRGWSDDGRNSVHYYGQECLELADRTESESQRIMLLHIADTWRRLAISIREEDD